MGNMCAEMKEKVTFCAGSVVERQSSAASSIAQNFGKKHRFMMISVVFGKGLACVANAAQGTRQHRVPGLRRIGRFSVWSRSGAAQRRAPFRSSSAGRAAARQSGYFLSFGMVLMTSDTGSPLGVRAAGLTISSCCHAARASS